MKRGEDDDAGGVALEVRLQKPEQRVSVRHGLGWEVDALVR